MSKPDYDAIVIGAGIFGSLITRALWRDGRNVLTIDDRREGAGSPPAACLMKPSWFSSLGKDVYEPALAKLDELVGLQEISFKVPAGSVNVQWCDPNRVLLSQNEVRTGCAQRLSSLGRNWVAHVQHGELPARAYETRLVIVATGIWTSLLFPEVEVTPQAGVAWLWPGQEIKQPKISVWAPYKQLVAFNRGDGLWVGDGTSVRTLDVKHELQSLERCRKFVGAKTPNFPKKLFGYRPYVKEAKPCYLRPVLRNVWVATGGAKNGTLAAGWCADQIVRATS